MNGLLAAVHHVEGQITNLLVLGINASDDGFVSFSDGPDTSALFELDANGQNFFTMPSRP